MGNDSEINIKVTATSEGVEQGMNRAAASVKEFGGIVSEQARVAAAAAESIDDRLKRLGLEKIPDVGLNDLKSSSDAAASSLNVTSGGMRELIVVGRELATGNFSRLPGSLSILATRLGGIPPQAILATAAIAAFGYALYEIVDSGQEFEAALAKIQNSFTATGQGDSFDKSQVTEYLATVRQIPGVTGEAADAIVSDFARTRNSSELIGEMVSQLKPFSELIGKDIPQAAKEMAEALNDPIRGIKLLEDAGVNFPAAVQEQIRQMMSVNDVGGAQRVMFEALTEAMSHVVDSDTGLAKFGQNVRNILGGVSEDADRTRQALEGLAAAYPMLAGQIAHYGKDFSTRNLPDSNWAGSAGSMESGDWAQEAKDRQAEQKKLNDAISDGVQLYDKGNSPLREQEEHVSKIARLQTDLAAATKANNDDAADKIQAQIDQENKLYAARLKREEPKRDKTDDEFARMIDSLAEKSERDQDKYNEAVAQGTAKAADAQIATQRDLVQQRKTLGDISAQEAISQLEALAEREHQINLQRIADMRSVYDSKGDNAGVVKTQADELAETQRYQAEIVKLNTQSAELSQQAWQKTVAPISKAFETSIQGMVLGTQTFQQAVNRAGQSIVAEFANSAAQTAIKWATTELQKTLATEVGAKARVAADQQGQEQGLIEHIETAGKHILTDAGEVFGNVFAYLSPDIGPFAAIPAAAASAAVLAVELPSAAGGMIVPSDTLAMVHQNEMVLPARYTSGLTSMIDQANAGGANAGHTFNNTFHVNAGDGVTAKQLPDMIVKTMSKAMRNGQFGGMRSAG